jgi:photosystem II stability/assembly factor-like uncharacterized protein
MKPIRVLRALLILVCLTPLAALPSPVAAQEPVFAETFSDATLPAWEHSPNATVVDGALRIEPGGFAMHVAFWADFVLNVRVRYTGEGNLVIRYRWSEDANYAVRLRPDAMTVQRQLLGPATDLAATPASIPTGQWLIISVTVVGDTHCVSLNGSPVLTAIDSDPLPDGGIGLLVEGEAIGEFDNLEVLTVGQATPPEEPTPLQEPTPAVEPTPVIESAVGQEGVPAYQATGWVAMGGPPGDLGYDIRYDFDDHDTWYVTDAAAGFFISHDRGLTWFPSNQGIQAMVEGWIPIFSATVDPHNPSTIWIGTQFTGQIYRSTDGGRTWEERDTGVVPHMGVHFRGFTVDPRSSDIVYAAAEVDAEVMGRDIEPMGYTGTGFVGGRVYRTTDAGQNWQLIWEGDALARYVWIDPQNPDVIYVSTGIFDRNPLNVDFAAVPEGESISGYGGLGVLKTTDGGQTWTVLGREHGFGNLHVSSLYMHPQDPQTLLAGTGQSDLANGGVYITSDGGDTWQEVITDDVLSAVEFCNQDPNIAYAGGLRAFYRSEDGGYTWQKFGDEVRKTWGPPGLFPGSPIDIQVDPDDCRRLFINNYIGGNFLSTDGGETWRSATVGYSGARILDLVVDPANDQHVYAAARMAPFVTGDGGVTWTGLTNWELTRSVVSLAVDPSDPWHLLASSEPSKTIPAGFQSVDGGSTWQKVVDFPSPPYYEESLGPWYPAFKDISFALSDPEIIYGATGNYNAGLWNDKSVQGLGILRSTDGGRTWEDANDSSTTAKGFAGVAVDPTDPQTVYAASFDEGIFKTTNGGASWRSINSGLPESFVLETGAPFFWFMTIAPSDPQLLFAGGTPGVFRSTDGGNSWIQLAAGLDPSIETFDLVVDPLDSRIVYLGTVTGPLYSVDGGETFSPLTQGLNDPSTGTRLWVNRLALSGDGSVLYAGTIGRGVYRLGTPSAPALALEPTQEPTPVPASTQTESQPTSTPEATATPVAGGGICPGATAVPVALLGLVWVSRRRQ